MGSVGELKKLKIGSGIKVISFFSGAGGLDVGFDKAGYDVVYATDMDHMCCQTLMANLGRSLSDKTIVDQADIRKINPKLLPTGVDLVIGGPPCQSFSASGRRAGGAAGRLDARGTLFEAYCNIINHVQPKAFLFENVRGILATNKGEDWRAIVSAFTKIGYKLSYRILDAHDYGAPQQRERMIMVGHKMETEFLFPRPICGPDSLANLPYVTAGEALAGLQDEEDKTELLMKNGKYAHLLPLVPPGENYLHFTAKRGCPEPVFAYRSRFSDFLYKANPATAIKTLIASPGKYTGPFHWENRCFTVKEYMRLQGFPDDYVFVGDRANKIKQIGNSVSPKLAYQMALAIAKQVFSKKLDVALLPQEYVLSFDSRKGKKAARTKKIHLDVAAKRESKAQDRFRLTDYEARVSPCSLPVNRTSVRASVVDGCVKLSVRADSRRKLFAKMKLIVYGLEKKDLSQGQEAEGVLIEVSGYGASGAVIQAMWNAVDDWVVRSSNFHSLFELYGHFTEPHPVFEILKFELNTDDPVGVFAKHAAEMDNCSKYFPRDHLVKLFGREFGAKDFVELVGKLRAYRFDIRCNETNIAIPQDVYMVAYPFTLPYTKQMNFSLRVQ